MNRRDPLFHDLTGALEVGSRELRVEGIGATVRHAPAVTATEEGLLWESKMIGDHDSLALLRAIFFYVGKTFCLRGGEEQRKTSSVRSLCYLQP